MISKKNHSKKKEKYHKFSLGEFPQDLRNQRVSKSQCLNQNSAMYV